MHARAVLEGGTLAAGRRRLRADSGRIRESKAWGDDKGRLRNLEGGTEEKASDFYAARHVPERAQAECGRGAEWIKHVRHRPFAQSARVLGGEKPGVEREGCVALCGAGAYYTFYRGAAAVLHHPRRDGLGRGAEVDVGTTGGREL